MNPPLPTAAEIRRTVRSQVFQVLTAFAIGQTCMLGFCGLAMAAASAGRLHGAVHGHHPRDPRSLALMDEAVAREAKAGPARSFGPN